MINSKQNYSYKIEISETIQLCAKNELRLILKCYPQNVFKNCIFNIYIFLIFK